MRLPYSGLLLAAGLLVLSGCSEKSETAAVSASSSVVAKVNGEEITEADIDLTLQRTFSNADLTLADAGLRDKVRDSLIASRAMKQAALQELPTDEVAQIRQMARAYEEELFVKAYLQRHASPEPVTSEMVQAYYNEHPQEFGAETLHDFELLKAPANLDDAARDVLLADVAKIQAEANWTGAAKGWSAQYGLVHQQGRSKAGLLQPALEVSLKKLAEGQTSDVIYVDGQLHLIRLKRIAQTPPKALSEVSGEIRQRLAPLQLRKVVKELSESARAQATVELFSDSAAEH